MSPHLSNAEGWDHLRLAGHRHFGLAAKGKSAPPDSPMQRFRQLTRSVLRVSNKAVLEAEAVEKVANAQRRKSKRKPASKSE